MTFNGGRFQLEQRADVARDRLLETIGALNIKRHEVLDWKAQLRYHARKLAAVSAAFGTIIALAVGVGVHRARLKVAQRRRERVRAVERFWAHPERVAVRRRRSLVAPLLGLIIAFTTLAVATVARRR